jgi:hypothetical protein
MAMSEIIAALRTVPGLEVIAPAVSLQALPDLPKYPAALVYPTKEVAEPNQLTTQFAVRQTTMVLFTVVLACSMDDHERLREAVLVALVGKEPDAERNVDLTVHVEGEIMELTPTLVWWRDVFGYKIHRRYIGA